MVLSRAIRYYCRLNKYCPIAGMYGDIGRGPGIVRCDIDCIRIYNHVVRMNTDRLTCKVLEFDFSKKGQWGI